MLNYQRVYPKVDKKPEFVHIHLTEQVARLVCSRKMMLLAALTEVPCSVTRFNRLLLVTRTIFFASILIVLFFQGAGFTGYLLINKY